MSSAPKKGRPRKNLDYRVHARRVSALVRRKADLAKYQAITTDMDGFLELQPKVAAAKRDIAGLEAAIAKGPTA